MFSFTVLHAAPALLSEARSLSAHEDFAHHGFTPICLDAQDVFCDHSARDFAPQNGINSLIIEASSADAEGACIRCGASPLIESDLYEQEVIAQEADGAAMYRAFKEERARKSSRRNAQKRSCSDAKPGFGTYMMAIGTSLLMLAGLFFLRRS